MKDDRLYLLHISDRAPKAYNRDHGERTKGNPEGRTEHCGPRDRPGAAAAPRATPEDRGLLRVYGSRVRGEATPDSDLDVYLVVTELTPALRRWIDEIAWEVGFDNDRVISTLVTTRRGLEQGPFGAQPVVQAIEREGIPV